MIRPRDMRKRAELLRLLEQLDEPTASAVLTVIEIVAAVPRRQAIKLIEAVSRLIATAPRRRPS